MRFLPVQRGGFTLFEVMVSLGISSLLMAGLATAFFIALRAADTNAPTVITLRAASMIDELQHDLSFATNILDRTSTMVEFTVPDRDDDGTAERIRYEWTARSTALTRHLNGREVSLTAPVRDFAIGYHRSTALETFPCQIEGSERVLTGHRRLSVFGSTPLARDVHVGQFVHPREFDTQLPDDAVSWCIKEVQLRARASGDIDGSFRLQIRRATGDGLPTSLVLGEKIIPASSLTTSVEWMRVRFDPAIPPLHPDSGVCLTLEHQSGEMAGEIEFDAGATWTSQRLVFRLIGTYQQQHEVALQRTYFDGYTLRLTLEDAVPMSQRCDFVNHPEVLAAAWSTQFSADPTTQDDDADGLNDWKSDPAGPLRIESSVWKAAPGSRLFLTSPQDFLSPTVVHFSCRHASPFGSGAICHIDADRRDGSCVPLTVRVMQTSDQRQSATLFTTDQGAEKALFRVDGLANEINDFRLLIDPQQQIAALVVNNVPLRAVRVTRQPLSRSQPTMYLGSTSGEAEFDHLSVRVLEEQSP